MARAAWLTADLSVTYEVLGVLVKHARQSYPNECCGLIAGPPDPPTLLTHCFPQPNLAADPSVGFELPPLAAARQLDNSRLPLKAIYHSHCDADASWSAADAHAFSEEGRLLWPCAFVVLSVSGGTVQEFRLWHHIAGQFTEAVLHIQADPATANLTRNRKSVPGENGPSRRSRLRHRGVLGQEPEPVLRHTQTNLNTKPHA